MSKKMLQIAAAVIIACSAIIVIILWDYIIPERILPTPKAAGGWSLADDLIGRTEEEADLPEGCIESSDGYKSGGFETEVFGADAKAYIYFTYEEPQKIREVFITTHDISYEKCLKELRNLYGTPEEGIRTNNPPMTGKTKWAEFTAGEKRIEVDQSTEDAYLTILIYIPVE